MNKNPLAWLSEVMLTVTVIPVLAMMVHVTLDVVLKYTINAPIQATLEITAYYYMVAIVVLPMGFVELTRQSIAVELFYQMMGRRMQIVCIAVVLLLSAASYALLAWIAWPDAFEAYAKNEIVMGVVRVWIWPARFLLPVALSVATAVCLMHLVRLILSPTAREELIAIGEHDPDMMVD